MNPIVQVRTEEILKVIATTRKDMREELKKYIKECVDDGQMNHIEALSIMKESLLFNIEPYVLEYKESSVFSMYNDNYYEKYSTVYFTDIVYWIDMQEGEVQEACDAAGEKDPYEQLYDYAMKHDTIGYVFDW